MSQNPISVSDLPFVPRQQIRPFSIFSALPQGWNTVACYLNPASLVVGAGGNDIKNCISSFSVLGRCYVSVS